MISGRTVRFVGRDGLPYWRVRLDYGRDSKTGRRSEPWLPGHYAHEKDAARALARELHERNRAPAADPKRRTVAALVREWLETDARQSLKPGNLPNYESCCRLHVVPFLGAAVASKLTTADVEQWRSKRLAAGVSRNMVGKAALHLGQAFKYGNRLGYLTHNPVAALKPLAREHREMAVWDQAQARAFLTRAQKHAYEPFWSLALATGMRCGELLALEWGDVDFAHGTLAVRRSLDSDPAIGLGATKSGRARVIDISPASLALLTDHLSDQKKRWVKLGKAYGNRKLVICTQDGHYLSQSNVNRAVKGSRRGKEAIHGGLCAAAGVPYIGVHGLRHTAATLMLAAGVPVKVVSTRLGHASIRITLDIYAHVLPAQSKDAAQTLSDLLFGTD